MSFEKRITLGQVLTIIAMLTSVVIFVFEGGEWKSTLEWKQNQAINDVHDLKRQVSRLNVKVDQMSDTLSDQQQSIDGLTNRMTAVEMKITKGLGLPPYGPNNPPPIIKYRHRQGEQQIE